MIRFETMTEEEFEVFLPISMKDQIDGHIESGFWKAEEAEANMQKLREQNIPQGLHTPNHFFYTLYTAESDEKIGWFWYVLAERGGDRFFFVMDIQILPEFRRKGYADMAFSKMEEHAASLGIKKIALHVFKHNTGARKLYEKLGYVGKDENMLKMLQN